MSVCACILEEKGSDKTIIPQSEKKVSPVSGAFTAAYLPKYMRT